MVSPTQQLGFSKEAQACAYLKAQGLTLIQHHYHCRFGEIDLIMQDNDCLVFIEVRLRRNQQCGNALESITASKQKKLVQTAQHYLQHHPPAYQHPCRFDVIAFDGDRSNPLWVQHAFDDA